MTGWYPMDSFTPGDGDLNRHDEPEETPGQHLDRLAAEAERDRIRDYVRSYYGAPAELGGRVAYTYQGRREGEIVGFIDAHLLVRLDGEHEPRKFHPTWEIEYLPAPHDFPLTDHEFVPAADGIECLNCLRQVQVTP